MAQTNKKEYKIAFMPSGKRGSFPEGTTILDASRLLGVDLDSVIVEACNSLTTKPTLEKAPQLSYRKGPTKKDQIMELR